MRPLPEMRAAVLSSVPRLGSETIPYEQAVGRILAEPLVSPENVPHFENSAMDGFAVRSVDTAQPGAVLEVLADVPAGQVAEVAVGEGQAIKIMTGAPMPEGADAVIRVEETTLQNGRVTISPSVSAGNSVRPAGGDIEAGETVFDMGTRLSSVHLGVLATIGAVNPVVSQLPRVAVMSTGDELQSAETADLAPGMIRDSNRPMIKAMLAETGVEIIDLGRISDDADELRAAMGRASTQADVIVTSGGVSMGDYDVIKLVLREEADVDFFQVAMKPGKPFGFGQVGGTPFFGLPGNPVSVLVSFEQFVRPALLAMQGSNALLRPRAIGTAGEKFESDPAKEEFVRVASGGSGPELEVHQTGGQSSNVLSAAARADAFAVIPVGVEEVGVGDPVILELFRARETRPAE
jgi:molybdopterin molybdotransferase